MTYPPSTIRSVEKITVTRLAKELKTEADAYVFMEKMRWATGVVCPHCGSIAEHYFLTPKSDLKTDEGTRLARRGLAQFPPVACGSAETAVSHSR